MTGRIFTSTSDHYEDNISRSNKIGAHPAWSWDTTSTRHPAVVLLRGTPVPLVLTPEDALRLANEIADALANHPQDGTNP